MTHRIQAIVTIALVAFHGYCIAATAVLAPLNLASESGKLPIVDSATGRISYIIDLADHLQDQFPALAAPHIAGVAAYLSETQTLGSPAAIEAAVRNLFFTTGQTDHNGLTLHYVQLP